MPFRTAAVGTQLLQQHDQQPAAAGQASARQQWVFSLAAADTSTTQPRLVLHCRQLQQQEGWRQSGTTSRCGCGLGGSCMRMRTCCCSWPSTLHVSSSECMHAGTHRVWEHTKTSAWQLSRIRIHNHSRAAAGGSKGRGSRQAPAMNGAFSSWTAVVLGCNVCFTLVQHSG